MIDSASDEILDEIFEGIRTGMTALLKKDK
jgi:hypothetical protein